MCVDTVVYVFVHVCPPLQALVQRSDHLAVIAAFNAWTAARASGGRGAAADFARSHFMNDQVGAWGAWFGVGGRGGGCK
jgi:hypothetical protein